MWWCVCRAPRRNFPDKRSPSTMFDFWGVRVSVACVCVSVASVRPKIDFELYKTFVTYACHRKLHLVISSTKKQCFRKKSQFFKNFEIFRIFRFFQNFRNFRIFKIFDFPKKSGFSKISKISRFLKIFRIFRIFEFSEFFKNFRIL